MLYCSHVNLLGQLDSMVTSVVGNRSFIVVLMFLTLICSLWQTAERYVGPTAAGRDFDNHSVPSTNPHHNPTQTNSIYSNTL